MSRNKKNPAVEALLEYMSTQMGSPRSTAFKDKTCVKCKEEAIVFKDKLSEKEYKISGFCQKCQDAFFENDPFSPK